MKITKRQLKRIIKEELVDPLPQGDADRFVDALKLVEQAVADGQLPESVEDAFYDMLAHLEIYM